MKSLLCKSFTILFLLGTASVSILGYEHDKDEPAVALWNSV